jgi:hypothetical protein
VKKGCLIVLIILVLLFLALVIAGIIGVKIADTKFGISLAPEISHETLCDPDTRIRLLIRPEEAVPLLVQYLPPDVEMPISSIEVKDVAAQLVPREIALLIKSNMTTRKMQLTMFVNERRGGPVFEKVVREEQVLDQIRQIAWNTNGFELRERGMLVAEGALSIPEAVEKELLDIWPIPSQQPADGVQGTYHAELVIDNRNGDLLALVAAGASAAGEDWEKIRGEQMADMAISIMEAIHVARLTANLVDADKAVFSLNIMADAKSGPGLQFLLSGVAMPWLRDMLKNEHDLILEGDVQWNEAQSAVMGEYVLTRIKAFVQKNTDQ